ncbi:type II secretion system F family protein [Thermaerobacter sp. FW80]|uniref:type II secretion system F family protein n=1 Tax=Thermaerobacter sp. FW80 TaxID=2546351 RepID=UPI00107563B5|nr:type II secretion system F family protein [Thermaerobacter sp. FW80]QBS37587.1 type II secretion system F family protein [Thermaerobacter sp. FW80]
MTYVYLARDIRTGRRVRGRIEAASLQEALGRLREAGYVALHVRPLVWWRDLDVRDWLRRDRLRLHPRERAVFFRQMAALLRAGIPLTTALASLAAQSRGRLQELNRRLHRSIDAGRSLHEALALQAGAFHPVHLALVRAAELSGTLDEAMARLAADEERRVRVEGKLRAAMGYPLFVLVVTLGVLVVMVTFVVPTLAGIFAQFELPLPWPTRFWVGVARDGRGLAGFVALAASIGAAAWGWARSPAGGRRWDAWKLRLPIIGPLAQALVLARITRALATLYRSGLPMLESLAAAGALAGNRVFTAALAQARSALQRGASLASALGAPGVFPQVLVDLVAVGEATGALDELLDRAARLYEDEADRRLDGLTTLVEPVLVLVMGAVVGFVAISVVLPILALLSGVTALGG